MYTNTYETYSKIVHFIFRINIYIYDSASIAILSVYKREQENNERVVLVFRVFSRDFTPTCTIIYACSFQISEYAYIFSHFFFSLISSFLI